MSDDKRWGELFDRVDRIERYMKRILREERAMADDLDVLRQQVQKTTEVEESAIQLLNGLAAQIAALKQDPAALQALADSLKSKSEALAAAVVANTPAG